MIIKWIVCKVRESLRKDFSYSQEKWSKLQGVKGFYGQTGGWDKNNQSEACVLGLWDSLESYENFMSDIHDNIFENNNQKQTYNSINVILFDKLLDIKGKYENFQKALDKGNYIRVAECNVKEKKINHFIQAQKDIWNPGMKESSGMLGGYFSVSQKNPQNFLVITIWKDLESHKNYMDNIFPELHNASKVNEDLENIKGRFIEIIPEWNVL